MLVSPPRIVNGVTWTFAPDWLNVSQACELADYDRGFMLQVIEADGVDLDCAGRIEKAPVGMAGGVGRGRPLLGRLGRFGLNHIRGELQIKV
jgi:hypothetical protein